MDEEQNVQTNSDNGLVSKRFKFMTNILRESKHRTKYVKSLERFTIDAMVSFIRIFASIGFFVLLTVLYAGYVFGDTARLPWIILQSTGIYIAGIIIILYYMISSRDRSMLSSVFVLIYSLIDESGRRNAGLAGNPKSVGIDYIDDRKGCIMHLDNGRVAKAIVVEGNLSKSVLPQVADDTADAVKAYLISRSSSSHEQLITSIKEINVDSQLQNLKDLYTKIELEDPQTTYKLYEKLWKQSIIEMNYNDIQEFLVDDEYAITQVKIIDEIDEDSLNKSVQLFLTHAYNGMMSYAEPINDRKDLVYYLSNLTALSRKGERRNAKKQNKPKQQIQKQ